MTTRSLTLALSALALSLLLSAPAHAALTGGVTITGVVQNGSAHPSDFTLQVKSGNSVVEASGNTLVFSGLAAGTHTITKSDGPSGYTVVWSGDCTPQGTVTIVPNIMKHCTATYVLGSVGTLVVQTIVQGGPATPAGLPVHVKKTGSSDAGTVGAGSIATFSSLTPGSYTVLPTAAPTGYSVSIGGACTSQGTVNVIANRAVTCTVTYVYGATGGSGTPRTERPPVIRPGR